VPALSRAAASILCLALLGLSGCATPPREPFTPAEQAAAFPEGFPDVRYTQDAPALTTLLRRALRPNLNDEVNALALSGGGANGAFGAGLLHGWTATGQRPTFQVVTGVSTGALTAPFAFLGPDWDAALQRAYTSPQVVHLLRGRGVMSLFTPGLYRREPLEALVRSYVTDELIRAVAAEHAKGRRLLVATTNLDTEQLIVWDMGAIASHGGPAARRLFAEVLVASASIPGVFPPSLIGVDAAGHQFQEMHVDGQTESAFFAFPPSLLLAPDVPTLKLRFYIVVNGLTESVFKVTPRSTIPILGRSFDVAGKAQVRSVLISSAEFCRAHGCTLRVAALPTGARDEPFDFSLQHERDLFAAGEAAMAGPRPWREVSAPAP
jgi:predicted acylesterase/phospholipase RssA